MPKTAKTLGDLFRLVAYAADIDDAHAHGLGRDGGVLGGQGRVHGGDQEHLQVVQAFMGHAVQFAAAAQAGQVGQPDQEQRAFADVLLVAGQLGQPVLLFGVLDGDHAPDLQVGRGGGGLGGRHQQGQGVLRQRARIVGPHRTVLQQGIQHGVAGGLPEAVGLGVAGLEQGGGFLGDVSGHA